MFFSFIFFFFIVVNLDTKIFNFSFRGDISNLIEFLFFIENNIIIIVILRWFFSIPMFFSSFEYQITFSKMRLLNTRQIR